MKTESLIETAREELAKAEADVEEASRKLKDAKSRARRYEAALAVLGHIKKLEGAEAPDGE